MSVKPFFIVGCGRSGTTLLKTILDSHSSISVMPETFFYKSVYPTIERYKTKPWGAVDRWWLRDFGINPDVIRPFLMDNLGNDEDLGQTIFRGIFEIYSEMTGCKVIGEKTPDHVKNLEEIRACFPGAKIIQIIRDPRAVVASFKRVKVGSNSTADIVEEWRIAEEILSDNLGKSDFLALRYEDLVRNPEANLLKICGFLEVSWDKEMLNFHQRNEAGFSPEQVHHKNTQKPLFLDSIDSWRAQLSQVDIGLIDWYLKEGMKRQGYQFSGLSIKKPRLIFAVSKVLGFVNKLAIRYPRQRLKAIKARVRLANNSTSK